MWILLLASAVVLGAGLVRLYDPEASLPACLGAGAVTGFALVGLVGFVAASFLGLTPASVALSVALVALPTGVLAAKSRRRYGPTRQEASPARSSRAVLTTLAAWGVAAALLLGVFDRALYETADGIFTGDGHNLGDLPFHIAIITGFAKGQNFPPEHPELAGVRLTYPFLADFVAAMLVALGADLRKAVLAENLVLSLALVVLLHRFAWRLTGDRLAAPLAPILVLLSGGLGFWRLFAEARHAGEGVLGLLLNLPHDYTITSTGELRWGNALTTLFIPQRALLLGVPLVVLVWTLWWDGVAGEEERPRAMWAAGFVAGLLPLAHAHAFAVTLGMGACLALLFPRWRSWAKFFGAALVLAVPQVLWMARGSSLRSGSFLAWQVGWDHGSTNPVWFWLMNTGLFLPLLALAFVWGTPQRLRRFALPFLLCFAVPNLLRLSPWIWDNIKFLFFWYLASGPLVALLVARLARRGAGGATGAASLVVCLTLAGALDVWRVASRQMAILVFDREKIDFSREVLEGTAPRSLILHASTYDSPVFLSGRRSLLGYLGHIGSQGLDDEGREQEIARIYAGAPEAEDLLRRRGVDYIVVGPLERETLSPNATFLSRFPVVGRVGRYELHRVR